MPSAGISTRIQHPEQRLAWAAFVAVFALPVRSVRFVQVEPRVRVTKQIESAMGKDGSVHCKFFQE